MCLPQPKAPSPPPPPIIAPPPPAPAPPAPPAPAPKPLQKTGTKPDLRVGSTKTSSNARQKTTAGSLRTGLNINTGGEGGLNV